MAKNKTTKKVKKAETVQKIDTKPEVTQEEFEAPVDPIIEDNTEPTVEVMNGDPAVLVESEQEIQEEAEPEEEAVPVEDMIHEETNKDPGMFRRMFGYIWNGQEVDY